VWLEGLFFVWFLVLGGIYVALDAPRDEREAPQREGAQEWRAPDR